MNPFEIRSQLIAQAQKHLTEQYEANLTFATDPMFKLYEEGMATAKQLSEAAPKFPTVEDVLKQAREFYKFVETGK